MADSPSASPKNSSSRKPAPTQAAPAGSVEEPAKAKFARALGEAKAGAEQLRQETRDRAGAYREKATATGGEWIDEAKVMGGQARERAWELANEGKTRATEAIFSLGKIVDENAALIDEKVGPRYGEYARSAALSMQDAAKKLDAKELGELGEDAKEFVRKSPGLAIGIAAVAGFMLARMFRRSGE